MQSNYSVEKQSNQKKEKKISFHTAVKTNANWLSSILLKMEKLTDLAEKESKNFVDDIKHIISEDSVKNESKNTTDEAIYLTWIKMVDPTIEPLQKEKLCDELVEQLQQDKQK